MSTYIDIKYINLVSAQLEKFAWKKDNLANCRCPICGDSQKNKTKARGYFYQKGNDFFYKCHNCGAGHSLYRFLESVSPSLTKEYSVERWKNGENGRSNYRKPTEEAMFDIFKTKPTIVPDLLKPLLCAKTAPANHDIRTFLDYRNIPKKFYDILYYTDNFRKYINTVDPESSQTFDLGPPEPRLVIPFFNKKGDVVAIQGRSLKPSDEAKARVTAKYITVKADKSIDRLWYGMWRANPKKTVYVVEGPLDSLFVPNTIAMVGVGAIDNVHPRFKNSKLVYALDNEPRNRQIIYFNEKLIEKGASVCIWPPNIKHKDINDMIFEMSSSKIKQIIDKNTYHGLEATFKLNEWKRL